MKHIITIDGLSQNTSTANGTLRSMSGIPTDWNAQRAGLIAEETLSMVPTNTYAYAPQDFIDINNLNNNPNAMAQMTSGYGLILEDFYS